MQSVTTNKNSNRPLAFALAGALLAVTSVASLTMMAQTPKPAAAATPAATTPAKATDIIATSVNVNGAGEGIDFHIIKWSTDAERDQLSAAWSQAGAGGAPAGGRGGAGRGGAAAGGAAGAAAAPAAAAPAAAAPAAAAAGAAAPAAAAPAAAAGGRNGGGGGAGARGAAAAPKTPEVALADALKDLPNVGYFWTSEVAGYLIRYAQQFPLPGGGSRIVLLTDHRLGVSKNNWRPAGTATPNAYEFTLIELRMPATGAGEGKASLTGKITIDPNTKTLSLDGYDTLPVVMTGVKLRPKT